MSHCPSPFWSTSCAEHTLPSYCHWRPHTCTHQDAASKHVQQHTVPSRALPTFWRSLPAVAHVAVHITTSTTTTTSTSTSTG